MSYATTSSLTIKQSNITKAKQNKNQNNRLINCTPCHEINVFFSFISFFNTTPPLWYSSKSEPKPQPGQNKGLRLILDAHTDQISSGTVFDNFKGFVTLVGGRESFPLTQRHSFLLKPGQQSYVAISATSVVSGRIFFYEFD